MDDSDNYPELGCSNYKRAQVRCRQAAEEGINRHSLRDLVDFSVAGDCRVTRQRVTTDLPGGTFYDGPLYGLSGFPGFLFAPNALSESLQKDLAFLAVSEFCEHPHATNIDLVPPKKTEEINGDEETMWELWKRDSGFGHRLSAEEYPSSPTGKKGHSSKKKYRCFQKLSWATLGYHYDWTARAYHEACKSPMPEILAELAVLFARTSLAVEACTTTTASPPTALTFTPSASIVNYYNNKSLMGGHRDDLEHALDKPVVSISLGRPALFLLGGKTKDDPVVPVLVRPGDVYTLGGESRLNFHGMARVLAGPAPKVSDVRIASKTQQITWRNLISKQEPDEQEQNDIKALECFLNQCRININVRQVYSTLD